MDGTSETVAARREASDDLLRAAQEVSGRTALLIDEARGLVAESRRIRSECARLRRERAASD
jgi:hypothetical protein